MVEMRKRKVMPDKFTFRLYSPLVFKFLSRTRLGNAGDASIILEWFVCTKTLTPLCMWEILVTAGNIGTLVYDYYHKLRS